MKKYPPIPRGFTGFADKVYVFDKLDGNNIRSEWSRKTGRWSKFGSREVLLDPANPTLGPAVPLFLATLAEPLAKIAYDNRWEQLTVFMEFWGASSFAGQHLAEEPKQLTLFDACPYKKGLLGPKRFRDLFEGVVPTPRFLGQLNWTPGYVERVWQGNVEGITFEGVVAKGGEGHKLCMTKAKTKAWIDKVHAVFKERAGKIIES